MASPALECFLAKVDAGFASESTTKQRNLKTFRFNLNRKVFSGASNGGIVARTPKGDGAGTIMS